MAYQLNGNSRIISHLFDANSIDFELIFRDEDGDDKVISVHKKLLSILSPVFKAFFDGDWKDLAKVEVYDFSYETFIVFCQCFYKDEVDITNENVTELFKLAKCYEHSGVLAACEDFMANQLTADNVANILTSEIAKDPAMFRKINEIITNNTEIVLKSDSFLSCSPDAVRIILKMDRISCPQIQVFNACIEWAKRRCREQPIDMDDVRRELDKYQLNDLIRYEEIDLWDLQERCEYYAQRFFTRAEMWGFLIVHEENKDKEKEKKDEQAKKRRKTTAPRKICFRFNDLGAVQIDDKADHTITFSVAESLYLREINISNIVINFRSFETIPCVASLKIISMQNNNEVYNTTREFKSQKNQLIKIDPREEILIEKDEVYELSATIVAKNPYQGRRFVRTHSIENKTVDNAALKIHEAGQNNQLRIIQQLIFEGESQLL